MSLSQIPLADYNALPAIRQSNLKKIGVSPLHYKHQLDVGSGMSPAMIVGDATHAAILEPQRFMTDYVTYPGPTRRGKEWEKFKADHAGSTFITQKERNACLAISQAVRSCPAAMQHFKGGKAEATMQWVDKETGLPCKARLDYISDAGLIGIKTARNVGPEAFGAQAARLGYTLQWAFYESGMLTVAGQCPPLFEIAVENTAPFDVVVYRVTEDVLNVGRDLMRKYMGLLKACTASDSWPGQCINNATDLKLPAWAAGFTPQDEEVTLNGEVLE